MYQICEIRKLTGGRYLVCLDEGIQFPLYGKELDEFSIHEDEFLKEKDYQKILNEILPKRAKLCAMHLLEKTDRTEHQLRKKLVDLSYPEVIAEQAIEYVKSFHYIDDVRYATNYISYRSGSKSKRQLEQELLGKGISKEVFQQALEQSDMPDEEMQIRRWLEKKHYQDIFEDQKEKEKIYRFLLRKGYNSSAILHVMRAKECEM